MQYTTDYTTPLVLHYKHIIRSTTILQREADRNKKTDKDRSRRELPLLRTVKIKLTTPSDISTCDTHPKKPL